MVLHNRALKSGFTLIELLVVVAIIAVLVAMLLPALGSARQRSISLTCLAKLKQIGMAYEMYKGDNAGQGPIGHSRGFPNHRRPAGWSAADTNPYPKWDGWYSWDWHALGPYLVRRDHEVSGQETPANSPVACPKHPGGHGAGYSVNAYLGYNTFLGEHMHAPSTTPMLMCGPNDLGFNYLCFPGQAGGGVPSWFQTDVFFPLQASYPHARGANYLFFDGHAVRQTLLKDLRAYLDLWTWYGD